METHARYVLVGLFAIAVIAGGFGFVYWLNNKGGGSELMTYRLRFEGPVGGLRVGANVLFNGIRVGEVTGLELDAQNPRALYAAIAIDRNTPVRTDTHVSVESQGLMGTPGVSLRGGASDAPRLAAQGNQPPTLTVDPLATQDVFQLGRGVLARIDKVLEENAEPLKRTMGNLDTFTGALSRNSDKLDTIVEGLVRLTGGGSAPKGLPTSYELQAPSDLPQVGGEARGVLGVAEPGSPIALQTQRLVVRTADGADEAIEGAQWVDTVPRMLQAAIIRAFENAGRASNVTRGGDMNPTDFQMTIDLREFQLQGGAEPKATIAFTAKIVDRDGKIIEAKLFSASAPMRGTDAAASATALNAALRQILTELVPWAAERV